MSEVREGGEWSKAREGRGVVRSKTGGEWSKARGWGGVVRIKGRGEGVVRSKGGGREWSEAREGEGVVRSKGGGGKPQPSKNDKNGPRKYHDHTTTATKMCEAYSNPKRRAVPTKTTHDPE